VLATGGRLLVRPRILPLILLLTSFLRVVLGEREDDITEWYSKKKYAVDEEGEKERTRGVQIYKVLFYLSSQ
jgi:hypothetical protein